jgi:uncharacterized cupin superfamily protein
VQLAPGQMLTPPHVHPAEEEIFHVVAGSATLWQGGKTCTVAAGDTIVHTAGGAAHTLIGGDDGFEALIFGLRLTPEVGFLPRTRAVWLANVVAPSSFGGRCAQFRPVRVASPHCHSADEEVFVILDGEGTFELWDRPEPGAPPASEPLERHPVRRGHVISRPAGTARSHCLRTREKAMTYLAYGTRDPNDVCYYPRSNKLYFRGLGLIARLEPLAYSDGEPG